MTLPAGTSQEGETCPVYGFVVVHPDGIVIVDTGVGGGHPGIDALYRPQRRPVADHLSALKIAPDDVTLVINTHLHFDHCGDNRLFPGTPVVVQRAEYEAAQESAYTVPDWVTFPGACFQLLDGETEVLPDLAIVPTPGHTPGHQSVVLNTNEGLITIAGQ
ncbi:MAG TPA: N-acyl homoserine lactonase family protein, partial [Dehalococcoidia bacterium]|nr:N-acyl homoserine lactonase family protein [Dehalococcoidia bacterium]